MNFLKKFEKSVPILTQNFMTITNHLFSKLEYKERNVVISPLSLRIMLGIIAAGSEGATQRQLLSFLELKSITNLDTLSSQLISHVLRDATPFGGPRLTFVNSVWVEKSLSLYPSFKKIVATDYMAVLAIHDFINKADKAIDKVNLWAEKQTNKIIRDVLSPGSIGDLTRLIFANALYFKGAWDQVFDASKTKDYDFYLFNDSSVKVPFMTSYKRQLVGVFDGFKVLCLPYKQGVDERRFSMYIFLPDEKDGLLALIEKMASESEFLIHNLPYLKKEEVGDFRIPKFEISFELKAANALKELGVVLPFSPSASLTKMVDSPNYPIWVSDIVQKSFIKVNEEGTEAAAITVSTLQGCCWSRLDPIPIDFVADHHFLFFIREDLLGTILFVGQVVNPLVG